MKTDRELLELAAKAAGMKINQARQAERDAMIDPQTAGLWIKGGCTCWNPLTDDGDALRLASKLLLDVYSSEACIVAEDGNGVQCIEYMYGPEDYASGWRRAIVRAAAAIGEVME